MQEIFISDPSIEDVPAGPLRDFYALWKGLKEDGELPRRKDFTPKYFARHLGMMALADFETATNRFRIRLFGAEYAERVGADLTGMYVDEIPNAEHLQEKFLTVPKTGKPYVSLNNQLVWGKHDFRRYHVVACPLFDEQGDVVIVMFRILFEN